MKQEGSDIVFSGREAQLCGITSFPVTELPQIYNSLCDQRDGYDQLACGPNGQQNHADFQRARDLDDLANRLVGQVAGSMTAEAALYLELGTLE